MTDLLSGWPDDFIYSSPDEVDLLDDPGQVVRQQCAQWAAQVASLRQAAPWPGGEVPPVVVRDALIEARSRLDQLEVILSSVMAVRAATAARARQLEEVADDAWDDQAAADRQDRRRAEYEGARERYAYWSLATRGQRRQAREARDLADFVRDVNDRARLAYDGLNGVCRGLDSRLAHLRWERSMEQ